MGIDPGITATGFGLIVGDERPRLIVAGEIRPRINLPLAEKLDVIFAKVEEVVREHRPDAVAIEGVFHAKNAMSAIKLGHARGIVFLAAARANIPVFEYSPREVKSAATGYGAAEKGQVEAMVRAILSIRGDISDHACDAIAVALCHLNTARSLGRREEL